MLKIFFTLVIFTAILAITLGEMTKEENVELDVIKKELGCRKGFKGLPTNHLTEAKTCHGKYSERLVS